MRTLPELGAFDLVTCIYDALNNLLSGDQLRAALEGFARNLRPGGLAIFDANTLHAYRVWYAGKNAKDASDAIDLTAKYKGYKKERQAAAVQVIFDELK